MRTLRLALFLLASLTAAPGFAQGVMNYSPAPAAYETFPGGTVDLAAALSNSGNAPVYVNGVSLTFVGSAASSLQQNPFFDFFDDVPGTFAPTAPVFVGALSEILVAPSTPAGTYAVVVELIGGAAPSLIDPVQNNLGAQTFTIVVAPPPPAGSLTMTTPSPLPSGTIGVPYSEALSVSGGTGSYLNWSIVQGDLPPGLTLNSATGAIQGTPIALTGQFDFAVSFNDTSGAVGSGFLQLTIQPPASTNATTSVGAFAQIASGGGWSAKIVLINPSSSSTVNGQIRFYADSGRTLSLPLNLPQFGLSLSASSQTFSLGPGESLIIEAQAASTLNAGWADVQANGPLSGYSLFQFGQATAPSEAAAPLDSSGSSLFTAPYDNTNGGQTGLAIANLAPTPSVVTVLALDQNGAQLASAQITLPPFGHMSFFLANLLPASQQHLGATQLQSAAGPMTAAEIYFSSSGVFTVLPVAP